MSAKQDMMTLITYWLILSWAKSLSFKVLTPAHLLMWNFPPITSVVFLTWETVLNFTIMCVEFINSEKNFKGNIVQCLIHKPGYSKNKNLSTEIQIICWDIY